MDFISEHEGKKINCHKTDIRFILRESSLVVICSHDQMTCHFVLDVLAAWTPQEERCS